ncbi:MAG: FHA domain-containing protein, partial [Chloroflexota bacterium]|nr:FHA domain-containing protein [Chloroflexota bacterium]
MSKVPAAPHLLVLTGPKQGSELPLDRDELMIGRTGHHNLIPTEILSLSRQHARLHRQLALFWLEDLDSENGTYFNPSGAEEMRLEPNTPSLLLEGSQIRLGPFVRLKVCNIQTSSNKSMETLLLGLHDVIGELYINLPKLNEFERGFHLKSLRLFEKDLQGAKDPAELAHLIEAGIQSMVNHLFNTIDPRVMAEPGKDQG